MGDGKKDAGSNAAGAANSFVQKGIDALRPFLDAGTDQLGALTGGATAGGLDSRIAEILNTDVFGTLVGERTRAAQGQLAAGGLTRSGTGLETIANIPTDLALQLENLLTGRSQGLAGNAQSAAGGLAGLFNQQGQNVSSGILSDAQAKSAGIGTALSIGSKIFFSDPHLKTNVEKVSEIGDLGVYEWDWIPGALGTIIWGGATTGFMADEVAVKYPHHVGQYGSWMVINMPALLDELEQKYVH